MYSYYQYITMNYCEDGLHTIKLMTKVYLIMTKVLNKYELIINMEMSTFFSGVSLYVMGGSGKF